MPDEIDPSGEQQLNTNPSAMEIFAWLYACLTGDGTLLHTVGEIKATNLVAIGYAPLLFCGIPGNPNALPLDGKKLGRCLVRWAEEIAAAIQDNELNARHPDGWMLARHGETITPDWLLSWSELGNWSYLKHGLSIGEAPSEIEKNASGRPKPSTALPTTYLRIIRALTKALADSHPNSMKKRDDSILVGTGKEENTPSGVVGHLIDKGYAIGVKNSCLQTHISNALKAE